MLWRSFKERIRMEVTLICWLQKCKIAQFNQRHNKIKNKLSKELNKLRLIMTNNQ